MGVVTDWLSREIRKVDRKRAEIRLGGDAWKAYTEETGYDPDKDPQSPPKGLAFQGIRVHLSALLDPDEMYIGSKRHGAYARMSTQMIEEIKDVVGEVSERLEATAEPFDNAPTGANVLSPALSPEAQAIRESVHVVTEDALGDDLPATEAP